MSCYLYSILATITFTDLVPVAHYFLYLLFDRVEPSILWVFYIIIMFILTSLHFHMYFRISFYNWTIILSQILLGFFFFFLHLTYRLIVVRLTPLQVLVLLSITYLFMKSNLLCL